MNSVPITLVIEQIPTYPDPLQPAYDAIRTGSAPWAGQILLGFVVLVVLAFMFLTKAASEK